MYIIFFLGILDNKVHLAEWCCELMIKLEVQGSKPLGGGFFYFFQLIMLAIPHRCQDTYKRSHPHSTKASLGLKTQPMKLWGRIWALSQIR